MGQSVHTQHCIKCKKLLVSAEWNSHHQASHFRNIKRKSYSHSLTFNSKKTKISTISFYCCRCIISIFFLFLNCEAWYWMFHTAETCSFLDLIKCCVWMDCFTVGYCELVFSYTSFIFLKWYGCTKLVHDVQLFSFTVFCALWMALMSVLSFDSGRMNILASSYICVFGVLLIFCFMVLCVIKFVVPHLNVMFHMFLCADWPFTDFWLCILS